MKLRDKIANRFCWTYSTRLSVEECIDAITRLPTTFGKNPLNLEQYDCIECENNRLMIIFRGLQYGKFMRTEYLFTFAENHGYTTVETKFQRELFSLLPYTSTHSLDILMEEKIQAYRNTR